MSGMVAGCGCNGRVELRDQYWVGWPCAEDNGSVNGQAVAVGVGVLVQDIFFGVALRARGLVLYWGC